MIETTPLYKQLFSDGAIQEYRLEINGTLYDGDVIYDKVGLNQKLFDKETYTIGSFVSTILETKLNLTIDKLPVRSTIKFSYRYTDGDQHSEWIQKFEGIITKRSEFNDVVTNITVHDKSINYDVFLDVISGIDTYPANARTVAIKCADHLGLTIVNLNDITNLNIVEFPNELTVVQVMQRIAAASGGNFVILENGMLKLLIANYIAPQNQIPCDDFSCFTKYAGTQATINKTYPIDTFKGGKNLLLNTASINQTEGVGSTFVPLERTYEAGTYTISVESIEQILNTNGMTNAIAILFYGGNVVTEGISFNLNDPKPVTITANGLFNIVRIYSGNSNLNSIPNNFIFHNLKLEKGSVATEWSPNPQDGYGYNGANPSYHIQTTGGTETYKLINQARYPLNEMVRSSVKVKAFNTVRLSDNSLGQVVNPNEYVDWSVQRASNGVERIGIQFRTLAVADELDFIACDASVYVIDPSIKQFPSSSNRLSTQLEPISKIITYWDDESAFESGDDTGTVLFNDNPWATQETNDEILVKLKGYVYLAGETRNTRLDPAYQLGDVFMNSNGHLQMLGEVSWTFDGACIADVSTPISIDNSTDDAFQLLNEQPLKRKVTLGDSYQGVTIDRQTGISMLVSPDGTENNATGKFYADLNRGMAFQNRQSPSEPWQDWLYFDIMEKVFKLALYSTTEDVDAMIQLAMTTVHYGSIIPNLNGDAGFFGWKTSGQLVYLDGLVYTSGMPYNTSAIPVEIEDSASTYGWEIFSNMERISPLGFTLPNNDFSFRTKLIGNGTLNVNVYEYSDDDGTLIKTTPFSLQKETGDDYVSFTMTPDPSTRFIALGFIAPTASPSNLVYMTESMFNIGNPKAWFENADGVRVWAESMFEIVGGRIDLTTSEIDLIRGDLHNAGVEINAIDGVTTYGKKFEVKSEDRNTTYMEVTDRGIKATNAEFVDASITGNLNAGKIANMQFNDNGIDFPNGQLVLNSRKNSIDFGTLSMAWDWFENQTGSETDIMVMTSPTSSKTIKMWIEAARSILSVDRIHSDFLYGSGAVNTQYIGFHQGVGSVRLNATNMIPDSTASTDLGTASLRFKTLYATTQPNVSSDSRIKKNIQEIDQELIDAFMELEAKQYNLVFSPDMINFGYIAQDVERILYKYTLKKHGYKQAENFLRQFALLHKDESYMSLLYNEINVIKEEGSRRKMLELEQRIKDLERND